MTDLCTLNARRAFTRGGWGRKGREGRREGGRRAREGR
jgi:hypothetical protein